MSRRDVVCRRFMLFGSVLGLFLLSAGVRASEDTRTVTRFLQELKNHGLHDQALFYINELRADPGLPNDLKIGLDYEEGRTLVDEASRSNDLVLREELLKDARDKLEAFTKNHPDRAEVGDALVQLAKLLLERGYLAMLQSEDVQDKTKKEAKVADARAAYSQSHDAYGKSVEALALAYKAFPVSMAEGDPRRAQRDLVLASYLNAMLQKGVADYELAHTYPEKAADRTKYLKAALDQFEALYKSYREQFAGLAAQMWQAKCFEEQGDIGAAIGLYKQLLGHSDPRLRDLQRNVGYFYIVALAKRKQYALAADEATRWLNTFNRRDELRSKEGLGVMVELAKAIDAQMPEIDGASRPKAVKEIIDTVSKVVRYPTPFKSDALALLKKYKPSAAIKAEEITKLPFKDVMERADEAIASQEWERAITLLKSAVRKADPVREIENLNLARYNLAFCYYLNKQFYEADILSEHLARRYPKQGLSPKATAIAMQSLADAYNTYTEVDRLADIEHLVELAKYTAETWPDREEGDDARYNLGQIHFGRGQYDQAIASFAAIRRRSTKWFEAQSRIGASHWAKSKMLEYKGNTEAAAPEAQKAVEILEGALKARKEAGAGPTDPGLVGNVGDLAIVLTETGKPADALKLLDPIVRVQTIKSGPAYSRLMEAQLTAYIASNQVQQAIGTMKSLEQSGAGASLSQLYFKLGKLLEKELDSLRKKGNNRAFVQMHQAYKTFLTTLAGSKSGQTYESLEWAGERLVALEAYKEAEQVLQRVLQEFTQDPQFLQQKNGRNRLLQTRLAMAAALRGQGKLDAASSLVEELLSQNPRYIEPQFEKGLLLEAEADAGKGSWSASLKHWEGLAKNLERMRPRPVFYYDAWYHVALVLSKQKEMVKARQTLLGVMRLNPSVGNSDMKAKYQALFARLSKS
ncbi:MAG: tetratricopeptide repeat protein [Isosphaeraceae bacterium]